MREMRSVPSGEETRSNPRCRSAVLYQARVRDPAVATAISRRGALRRLHQRADSPRVFAPIESVRHEALSFRKGMQYEAVATGSGDGADAGSSQGTSLWSSAQLGVGVGWRTCVLRGVQPDALYERHGPRGALRPRRSKDDRAFAAHAHLLAED